MLVVRFRLKKAVVALTAFAVTAVLIAVYMLVSAEKLPKGADLLDRTAYLASLGYSVDDGSEVETNIKIPSDFEGIYGEYNITQKQAGFDLAEYSGSNATMYTYSLSGFKSFKKVYANLLVSGDRIIGGDISTLESGGYTLPLVNAEKQRLE